MNKDFKEFCLKLEGMERSKFDIKQKFNFSKSRNELLDFFKTIKSRYKGIGGIEKSGDDLEWVKLLVPIFETDDYFDGIEENSIDKMYEIIHDLNDFFEQSPYIVEVIRKKGNPSILLSITLDVDNFQTI